MSKALSLDLRERAMARLAQGERGEVVAAAAADGQRGTGQARRACGAQDRRGA